MCSKALKNYLTMGRAAEYGALVSVILLAPPAGKIKESPWKLLRISVILPVLSSICAYTMDENKLITRLTYPEQYTTDSLSPRIHEKNVVFADYRLAAPLLGEGHFRTTDL